MSSPLLEVDIAGETFLRLDLTHPGIEARILEEMASGVEVYYDREWPFTRRFCRLLLERRELVEHRDVLVAGAGVGLEAVVAGRLCRRLWINDRAPEALRLLRWQLRENGVHDVESVPGSFAEIDLPPVDVVLACFVVYDLDTRRAARALERRAHAADVPLLLGGEDIGGYLTALLEEVERPVETLSRDGGSRIVRIA